MLAVCNAWGCSSCADGISRQGAGRNEWGETLPQLSNPQHLRQLSSSSSPKRVHSLRTWPSIDLPSPTSSIDSTDEDMCPQLVDELDAPGLQSLVSRSGFDVPLVETESRAAASMVRDEVFCAAGMQDITKVTRARVDSFLAANGFSGLMEKRRHAVTMTSPLHVAVVKRDAEMVALLLRVGADPLQKNLLGHTPQQLAQRSNRRGSHERILDMLGRTQ